jgi:hypothetical protein
MVRRGLVMMLVAVGCGGEVPPPQQGPLDLDVRSAEPKKPPVTKPEEATMAWTGVPVGESQPPGVKPLAPAEAEELAAKCKPLETAVFGRRPRKGASADPASVGVAEAVLEVLESPPPLQGVDVPRCADLLKRDITDFLARSREQRAIQALRIVLVGLGDRAARKEPPCPAAPAVPADLTVLEAGPYESKKAEYEVEGWKCARFDPLGAPQPFQVELVTIEGKYRVIARLYPVKGGSPTELFAEAPFPEIGPTTPILRREATRPPAAPGG